MKNLWKMVGCLCVVGTSPAWASDGAPYAGIEVGLNMPRDMIFDSNLDDNEEPDFALKNGFEGALVAGYDLGAFRLEGEFVYKQANIDLNDTARLYGLNPGDLNDDFRGIKNRVYSVMANALLDVPISDGLSGYVGAGIGIAWQNIRTDFADVDDAEIDLKDHGFAWQLIAGIRAPISQKVEVGLKYRYFDAGRFDITTQAISDPEDFYSNRFRSHSVLATLTFNLGGAD